MSASSPGKYGNRFITIFWPTNNRESLSNWDDLYVDMFFQKRCPFECKSNYLNAGQSFLRHDSNSYDSTTALIRLRLEDLYEQTAVKRKQPLPAGGRRDEGEYRSSGWLLC